ncbi:Cytoskeleton protein RodZ [Pseudoalteromonas sp. P1-9]|uniref:RodZ domain-containing protein n=1 Tax=Pseudoalteromonas sp. P1-9 TaxID=1710354 RepID=UPI0006D5ED7D|nr:RodZ domain-containing protein [Pseudoalteromonas sp. P1-9]KPV95721.1 Cytoskeleton protein RodZ [Pseudoalteromonas sp. P1-9]
MTEEVLAQEPITSLGEQLATAREQHAVSIDEMAHKLKLTAKQISAIECDDYSQLGPVTFVKGHIRSYCREFNLNEAQLMSQFRHQREETEKRMQSFSRRTEREAKDNRLMLFSYAIIALILGSSLFIWWQNREPAPTEAETSKTVVETPSQENSTVPVVTERKATNQINLAEISQLSDDEPQQISSQEPETTPVEQPEVAKPAVVEKKSDTKKNVSTIVMTFKDDSWVEIFDADGERVAFGVKKKGYVMTLDGKAPFNVVLGKHYIVDVEFNGELVDMSHFPTNRLAKFSLPLSE